MDGGRVDNREDEPEVEFFEKFEEFSVETRYDRSRAWVEGLHER